VSATVTLEPWGSGDLPLLERLMGDPSMTEHLGGPESPDKLRERQSRYERLEGRDRMFKIVDAASDAGVGSVGLLDEGVAGRAGLRGRLDGRAGVPGPRYRGGGDRAGDRVR
jgi:hypothetical protein